MTPVAASDEDDPIPAYIFASWLSFLIPASYACVHGPDVVADGFLSVAALLGWPLPMDATLVIFVQNVSGIFLVITSGVLFSGYLLFTFAPPAKASRALTYVAAFATCTLCALLFPFSAWVWGGVWEKRMAAGLFTWVAWLLYFWRCVGSGRALRRHYVLFFRRFDSFADLSILPSLLRLTPRGVPVVMLVSGDENEIGYWDPFKLMTYGVHANISWGGRPLFLRGGQHWERVMESLVDRSAVVVLDQTETSDAMNKEIDAVTQAGRPLILLVEADKPPDRESDKRTGGGNIEIAYHRDRRAFALRAALVVLIVAITVYLVELPSQLQEKAAQGRLWGGFFGAAIMLGFVAAVSGGLLLRRGLSRRFRRDFAEALRSHLDDSV